MVAMDPELSKVIAPIVASMPALLGALVGALMTYVVGHQLRAHNVILDRQKARRERETSRLLPFLEVVDQRVYQYAGVVGSLRSGDAAKFREAFNIVISAEVYSRSSVMVLARRQNGLAVALQDFMTKEAEAKDILGKIANEFKLDESKGRVSVDPHLIDALAQAQQVLSVSIADLYDAIDDYLDGPVPH